MSSRFDWSTSWSPNRGGLCLLNHLSSCLTATLSFLNAWEQMDGRQQAAIFIGNVDSARSSQIARLLRSSGLAIRPVSPDDGAQRYPGRFSVAICDLAGTNPLDWATMMLTSQTASSSIWIMTAHSAVDQKQITVLKRTLPSHVRVFQITQQDEEKLTVTVRRLARDISDKTCLLYTSPSPRDLSTSRMPSSA